MAHQRESLSELAFVERELSWLADEAIGQMDDARVAEALRRVRDQHEQAAVRLSKVLGEIGGQSEVPGELREEVRALQYQVRHARDDREVIAGLLNAERTDVRLHEDVLDAGLAEDAGKVVREHLSTERDNVGFFTDLQPALARHQGADETQGWTQDVR